MWLVSIFLTIYHTLEEVHEGLDDYLIKGTKLKRWPVTIGIAVITPLIAIALILAGWWSVLLGMRVGDAMFTHLLPTLLRKEKNPGFQSSSFYVVEAVILMHLVDVWSILGIAPFVLLWPLLWSFRDTRRSN